MNSRVLLIGLGLLVVVCLVQSIPAQAKTTNPGPKKKNPPTVNGKIITPEGGITGSYIVKYNNGVSVKDKGKSEEAKGRRLHRTENLNMILMKDLTEKEVQQLASDPDVETVEQDQECSITCAEYDVASYNLWGLDRIDQSGPVRDNKMYINNTARSRHVHVYVLDTGVDEDHPDFMGRAKQVHSVIDGQTTDGNGHGTHCAGTIAGANFGVAKKARIRGVKVLSNGGSGSYSGVIAGIEYVVDRHNKRNERTGGQARTVISMSLGGGKSTSMNQAIADATAAGIPCIVAAGNSNSDVEDYSPASAPEALTVAASDRNDYRASFSNYGELVDIFAPGVSVLSAAPSDCSNPPPTNVVPDQDHPCMTTSIKSGTSMATPHMAGIVANYMKFLPRSDQPTPQEIFDWVTSNAEADAIISPRSDTTADVGRVNPCYEA